MNTKSLLMQQMESKMKELNALQNTAMPPTGWVKAVRNTLGVSLLQLGNKLKITKQSARSIELREKEKTITLKSLEEAANALDMKLVYGFVPKDGSLVNLIDRKANILAKTIVRRVAENMVLDAKNNSNERIQKAIVEKVQEIKNTMPKALWD